MWMYYEENELRKKVNSLIGKHGLNIIPIREDMRDIDEVNAAVFMKILEVLDVALEVKK